MKFLLKFKKSSYFFFFSYQLPHVRRRHKIQEIAQKFKRDMSEPELLASLFADPV